MKIPMTGEILDMVLLVQAKQKELALYSRVTGKNVDWFPELEKYCYYLPYPDKLHPCKACFNALLCYPITDEIMNTQEEDLPKLFEFGY